jgi:hypothetical protein
MANKPNVSSDSTFKLDGGSTLDDLINKLTQIGESDFGILSLSEARQKRLQIKKVNKLLSEAAALGGKVSSLLGQQINNLQVKQAEQTPTETVAAKLLAMQLQIDCLEKENKAFKKED